MFRKPTGNQRITRYFNKNQTVGALYDFIETLPFEELGFEQIEESADVTFELVLPPSPQIKVLADREKTLVEEGLHPRCLINIK